MKTWMWTLASIALGMLLGWAYWNWVGCTNGCAITGQWWSSTAYGGVMGYLLLGMMRPSKRPAASEAQE